MNTLEEWEGCLSAREFQNKYSIDNKGEGAENNATETRRRRKKYVVKR